MTQPQTIKSFFLVVSIAILFATAPGSASAMLASCGGDFIGDVDCTQLPSGGGASTAPTATLTANPGTIDKGSSAQLTWTSTGATSCTGNGFSTVTVQFPGGAPYGSAPASPAVTTDYSVTCGSASDHATVTVIQPVVFGVSCSVSPTSAATHEDVTWTAHVTGGTPPYTYAWSGDNLSDQTGVTAVVQYLSGGVKHGAITVTDSSGSAGSGLPPSTWQWGAACAGTPTGYGDSDIEDGGTYNHMRAVLEHGSQNIAPAPPDFAAHPENYCVEGHISQSCPVVNSGTCYHYLDWEYYYQSTTKPQAPDPIVMQVDGDSCSRSASGNCYQGDYGTRVWNTTGTTDTTGVTAQCSNTVTVDGPTGPACSDGDDNDGDGLVDRADPGCSSGGTYNPNAATEATNPHTSRVPQCSDGIDNDGNGKADFAGAHGLPADPNCSSASDDNESPPIPALSLHVDTRIRAQTSATITWSATNVKAGSCTVSDDSVPPIDHWAGPSGSEHSSLLTNQTVYTLRCTDLGGHATSTKRTVFIAPDSGEQ
jgi:hypothetical protein